MAGGSVDWVVAGLGNPGKEYSGTRHDLGAAAVARLARDLGVRLRREADADVGGPAQVAGGLVLLVKPRLFMNRSGPPLQRLLGRTRLGPDRLLVVCDDVNLELGRLRLREGGSAGGHNGLKSIIGVVGPSFPRLRLGVGRTSSGGDLADWVLARFEREELPAVQDMLGRAVEAIRAVIDLGVERAMSRLPALPSARREGE